MRTIGRLLVMVVMVGSTSVWAAGGDLPGSGTEGDPYLIEDLADFDEFADSVNAATYWASGVYTGLACDIDLTGRTYTTAVVAPDTDNTNDPLSFDGPPFSGSFDGDGHVISNLTIDTAGAGNDYLGLFGRIKGYNRGIKNLGMENINITGGDDAYSLGGLSGSNMDGTISNCYSTGTVSGNDGVGGLCGSNMNGTISNCHSTGTVSGNDDVGGLCGSNYGEMMDGTIRNCYSTGTVSGNDDVGGLCGSNMDGTISNCYATGTVSGNEHLGGLCGGNLFGTISNCYATGSVGGEAGNEQVGGLCGRNYGGGIANCYATGSVTGDSDLGGLCGYSDRGITNCFWDIETGGPDNGVGTPLPTAEMQTLSTFVDAGWDFTTPVWAIDEGVDYPRLWWAFMPVLSGSGTEGDPYRIEDLADLQAYAYASNAETYWASGVCTRLMCDIDLGGRTYTTAVIAPDTSQSGGFNGTPFRGVFDGVGHVISNLTVDTAGADNDYLGLFGRIERGSSEVKDLGMENTNITGGDDSRYLGGLCGVSSGTITNCYSGGVVSGGVDSRELGGLCGADHGGIISNCYSDGSVTGGNWSLHLGGLCGYNGGATTNCYATGSVTGGRSLGGLCGANGWNATTANCYATGSVTGGPYRGGLVGFSEEGTITNCFWDIETGGPDSGLGTPLPTEQMQALSTFVDAGWDFTHESANGTHQIWQMPIGGGYPVLSSFNGDTPVVLSGEGTEASPYLINDANELGAIYRYDRNACFKLESDIDLIGITWTIAIVPVFSGCFDGDGHVIGNLTIDTSGAGNDYLGLFGRIKGSSVEVKDLGMEDINITGGDNSIRLGGVCGYNGGGTITDCYVAGSVTSRDNSYQLGGVCGFNWGGTITNCYATGSVTAGRSDKLGGLCGFNYEGTITYCYATGVVSGGDGSSHLGGLCGDNAHGTITNCYAGGAVSGGNWSSSLGGLCGDNYDGTITNCYSGGSVNGLDDSHWLGGLCGNNGGTITNCYSGGVVTGGSDLGGLCGVSHGTITNCYATGSVSGGDGSREVGGLCGMNGFGGGTISNCYATGSVSGGDGSHHLGGLCGWNGFGGGTISNCYATGSVAGGAGSSRLGGLCGSNEADYGTITNCLWDIETGGPDNGLGTPLPTEQMQALSTFVDAGWDFTTPIWTIDEGVDYPRLWWEFVPVLHTEPELTLGTNNSISWDPVAGNVEYYLECAEYPDFTSIVSNSGWIVETSCEFIDLQLGQQYWYRVKAINAAGVETGWSNVESSLQSTLGDAVDVLLDPASLKNENMKNALLNKIDAALAMIEEGNYTGALSKLEHDILAKTNGCAETGEPDKNDWILACEQQSRVYGLVMETIEYVTSLME